MFSLRLYIVGGAPNSALAIFNISKLCSEHLLNRHHLEIVDVLHHPKRALDEGVLLTPTLVRILPAPVRRVVGTLRELDVVLGTLGITASAYD